MLPVTYQLDTNKMLDRYFRKGLDMRTLVNRAADRILARVAPQVSASASCYDPVPRYCYCSLGIAYTKFCETCYDFQTGGQITLCSSCGPSGTC